MCPSRRTCAMLLTVFVATEILLCGLKKEDCPYLKNKEPDEPLKKVLPLFPQPDSLAIGTASTTFTQTNIGEYIGNLPDGKKIYFLKPQNIQIIGGAFKIVDNEGKENTIKFEGS